MSLKDHWNRSFQARDEDQLTWYEADGGLSKELIDRHGNTSGGVLIVGAGLSRLVDVFVQQGVQDLDILDISDDVVRQLQARLAGKTVGGIVADITNWSPLRRYSVWQDRAVFHFLTTNAEQDAYLRAALSAVSPEGVMVMGTFAEDGPEKCSGQPVARYSCEALAERVAKTCGDAFEPVESLRHLHHTPAGNVQPFTFVVFRRVA